MTRKGKIARLPQAVRDELNLRLFNGELGVRLVAWLNSLPETKRVMAAEFGGREINEPNLSEWKAGGYQDWLAQREIVTQTRAWMAEVKELTSVTEGHYADHLATLLGARYATVMANWCEAEPEELRGKLRVLREVCADVAKLQKGDHMRARLKLEQDQLKWAKEDAVAKSEFEQRTARDRARAEKDAPRELTQEEAEKEYQRIFGMIMKQDDANGIGPN